MKTYLVGGAVRDTLLNIEPRERDWVVVGARVEDMLTQGFKQVGKDFPVFIHPETGEEYALARTERKSGSGHTGFICHSSPDVTLEEDLLRRDLTINAMAMDADGNIIDPYHGQADLQARILRHVSNAFTEDPLRVLRIARFAARFHALGFSIASETIELAKHIASSGELLTLPAERIWKETERSLAEKHAEAFFVALKECAALEQIFPELSEAFSMHMELLSSISKNTNDPVLRLAYMLHNLSEHAIKAFCKHLHVPNHYRDACLVIHRQKQFLRLSSTLNGATLFSLIENLDAFRRPYQMEWLCDVISATDDTNPIPTQLRKALQITLNVNTATLSASGFSGKALGDELRKQRLGRLQEFFS